MTPGGFTHLFAPENTTLEQAEAMVKVLRKVRKGLHQATIDRGCLTDDQFAEYTFRIAASLGINVYHVSASTPQKGGSRKVFTRTDGAGVQTWITDRVAEVQPATD